jgi:hypothetical protein
MKNVYKEVSMSEYNLWSLKSSKPNLSHEDLKEFLIEIQSWNLYDLTYQQTDKDGKIYLIREYGIPTPYLQLYLSKHFSPKYDFSKNGISNLTITPHTEEFRSKKLNDGKNQGDYDRHPSIQWEHLRNWKEMLNSN